MHKFDRDTSMSKFDMIIYIMDVFGSAAVVPLNLSSSAARHYSVITHTAVVFIHLTVLFRNVNYKEGTFW